MESLVAHIAIRTNQVRGAKIFENYFIESFATLFTLIRFRKSQLQSQLDSRLRSFESQLKRLTFHLKFGREKK